MNDSDCFFPPCSTWIFLTLSLLHAATGATAPHSLMGQTVSRPDFVSLATAMPGFPP